MDSHQQGRGRRRHGMELGCPEKSAVAHDTDVCAGARYRKSPHGQGRTGGLWQDRRKARPQGPRRDAPRTGSAPGPRPCHGPHRLLSSHRLGSRWRLNSNRKVNEQRATRRTLHRRSLRRESRQRRCVPFATCGRFSSPSRLSPERLHVGAGGTGTRRAAGHTRDACGLCTRGQESLRGRPVRTPAPYPPGDASPSCQSRLLS